MRPVDEPQRREQERRANTARRSSRLLAPSLRSGDCTSLIARQPKTLAAINRRGSQPITPEPAPSPRLGASAGARPFTDTITLTRTPKIQAPKGTCLLCWKRGHFHFALTRRFLSLDFRVPYSVHLRTQGLLGCKPPFLLCPKRLRTVRENSLNEFFPTGVRVCLYGIFKK
jgi:hypothetical protein